MKQKKALRLAVDFHCAGAGLTGKLIEHGKDMNGDTYGPQENWSTVASGVLSVMARLEKDAPITQAAIEAQIKKLKADQRADVKKAIGSMEEFQNLPEGP